MSSDTRKLRRGDLFFAIKGSHNNGEKFINVALRKGACAIISSKKVKSNFKTIKVKNGESVLGKFVQSFMIKNQKIFLRLQEPMEKVQLRIIFISC